MSALMNLRPILTVVLLAFFSAACTNTKKEEAKTTDISIVTPEPQPINTLSESEQSAGWELLFDGKTSRGWRGSKFSLYPDFGLARRGSIGLQDHGQQVWFRNIKIREL